jgi:uncharacterized protein (DUF2235 family)
MIPPPVFMSTTDIARAGKTIVICSDGTGNSYTDTPGNVLRLYELILKESAAQIACYDPGIGTHPLPSGRWPRLRHLDQLLFGTGAIENVIELYIYLMQHYEPGDRIFLFGFSRGAFTVRALAGMLHVCGLVRRDDVHLVSDAAGLYQTSEQRIRKARRIQGRPRKFGCKETRDHASLDREAADFKKHFGRPCSIAFMGLWDTVKAYGWMNPRSFPALRHNPDVKMVRHALSLGERREFFLPTTWGDRHDGIKEVWFAGDDSDVGGGHKEGNSALSDASLLWMLGEATCAGLRLKATHNDIDDIVKGSARASSENARDLWWTQGYWIWERFVPRAELNNDVYPPKRIFRFPHIPPGGRRHPADSDKCSKITTVLFHRSVERRTDCTPKDFVPPRVKCDYVDDQPITWRQDEAG